MAKLTAKSLIKELENLDHAPRAQRVGQLGHTLSASDASSLCESLADLGDTGAQTAVGLARHAKLAEQLIRLAQHPSEFVRRHSIRSFHTVRFTDEQLVEVFLGAAHAHRSTLLSIMRTNNRSSVARAIIETGQQTDRGVAKLLSASDEQYVRLLLPQVSHAINSWSALAREHPDVVVDLIRHELAATPPSQQRSAIMRWSSSFSALSKTRPTELLSIFTSVADDSGFALLAFLPHLIRVAPAETARYIGGLPNVHWVIHSQPIRRCLRLLRNQPTSSTDERPILQTIARRLADKQASLALFLKAMPPSEREALLAHAFGERSIETLEFDDALLEALPASLRAVHARRMLSLRSVAASPEWALRVTSFLPFDEAWPTLESASKRSDADQRGNGYARLIFCAAISQDPESVSQMLQHLTRLKNDQDPVRMTAINMLARMPATKYRDSDAGAIESIADSIIDARDTSYSTRSSLQHILLRILTVAAPNPTSALFASTLRSLVRLAGRDGNLSLPLLERHLRTEHVVPFVNALMPLAKSRAQKDQELLTLSIARSLGRLAWGHADLQKLLASIAVDGAPNAARSAVDLYLADPRTRGDRAQRLVAKDQSYLLISSVSLAANKDRQHLLTALVEGKSLRGRFASKREVATVPLFRGSFHRWAPKHIVPYGELVTRLVTTPATSAWERASAFATLSLLPEVGRTHITAELARNSTDVASTEAAIAALANTDRPQLAVPTLLTYANSDRARVAIYAIGRAVRRSLPGEVDKSLRTLPNDQSAKITSRKEAIRLLAELQTTGADATLAALNAQPQLHKDLRIALMWAAMVKADTSWFLPAVHALRDGSVDEQQALLDLHPFAVPSSRHNDLADAVASLAQSPDVTVRQRAYQSLRDWVRWSPAMADLGIAALQNLDEPLWSTSASFLQQLVADRLVDDDKIEELVTSLMARLTEPASSDRDLPILQRLNTFANFLCSPQWANRKNYAPLLMRLANRYGEHDLLIQRALDLAIAAIDWSAPFDVRALSQRQNDSMLLAYGSVATLTSTLSDQIDSGSWDQSATLSSVSSAMQSSYAIDRYTATQITTYVGARLGWPDDWRALLTLARTDADVDVRRCAHSTFFISE
jgi:hypothetical protein